ncbi:MAG: aryl-sulfate sulfotransferase [Campylobacter sp.]|nr:aryl-sulfate sulfotransferase [Campylobacter sp.]
MRKFSFLSTALAVALSSAIFVATPVQTQAGVLAHQVKIQGELGRVYINPYDVSPLTAIIDRAGKDITDIHVRVLGKPDGGIDINYNVSQNALLNHDGVPIWGLYPNYLNQVEVSYKFEGVNKKETYKIYAQPIVTFSRDFRFEQMQKRIPKKVDPAFKNRLYLINNTITSNYKPFDWSGGKGGAAAWNDYTENYIVDTKGEIRWYLDYTKFYDRRERNVEDGGMMMGFHQLPDGDLSFGMAQRYMRYDLMGKAAYNRLLPRGYIDLSHEVLPVKGDHLLLRVGKYDYHHKDGRISHTIRDHIIEVDASGKVVNEWDLNEIFGTNVYRSSLIKALDPRAVCLNIDMNAKEIQISDDTPFGDKVGTGTGHNWAHVNSISYDASDEGIILSLRHQGIVKIGKDKKIKWILASPEGWSDDFKAKVLTPVDKNGKKIKCEKSKCEGDFDWSWTQHTAWLTGRYDNKGGIKHISVFDNGDARGMEQPVFKEDKYSRAVEYKIDEKNLTVEQTWEFGKERGFDFYSAVTSNVEWQNDTKTYYISSSNVNLLRPDKTIKMVLVEIDPKTNDIKFEMDVESASRDDIAYRSLVINPNVFEY